MELRHIYGIAKAINESIKEKDLKNVIFNDLVVDVKVSPVTHYGIDREFYRQTHNNNEEGFRRTSDIITANVDGVNFRIINKGES